MVLGAEPIPVDSTGKRINPRVLAEALGAEFVCLVPNPVFQVLPPSLTERQRTDDGSD